MKKAILALCLIVVMALSTAAVFAQNDEQSQGQGVDDTTTTTVADDTTTTTEAEDTTTTTLEDDTTITTEPEDEVDKEEDVDDEDESDDEDVDDKDETADGSDDNSDKKRNVKRIKIKREVKSQVMKEARERLMTAKQNYDNAVVAQTVAKAKFQAAKKIVQACKKDGASEECTQAQEEIQTAAKDTLMNVADRILEHMAKIRATVEANENLEPAEAEDMLAEIDEQIASVEEIKAAVEAAEEKSDIIEAGKELKKEWNKIQKRVKLQSARAVVAGMGNLVAKAQVLGERMELKLDQMAEEGLDTAEIEPLVDEYNALVASAQESYDAAVAKYEEAKASEPVDAALVQEGNNLYKAAREDIKEAHQKLREIFGKVREMTGSLEVPEVEE